MGVQTMGSQGGGGGGGGGSGNGDLGKLLTSMNLDELLKNNVWTVEANNSVGMDAEGVGLSNQSALQREPRKLTSALSKKAVDETGVVAEPSDKKIDGTVIGVDPNVRPQFPQQGQPMPQPLPMGPSSVMDVIYPDNQVALSSPLMGALSDTQAPGRKRVSQEARKQAYTNELENKVSRLEEENERLRKRKVYIFF
ncbi:hypothetical protein VitviT2T_024617 [Vitis vinifera]|uniref:BZIP domain-containing protein n=1 Tax=Vitis vinifera TaxID=29760 RepID=A0ABY9DI51_VITVI|nr:hypothetical protein VitviT2T_024617 [Vitis vinifera]